MIEWNIPLPAIDNKIFLITDNGRNIVNAAKLISHLNWRPCFAHTLQLVVEDGMKDRRVSGLQSILQKCRAIVGHFKHSALAMHSLEQYQRQLDLPRHRLAQDVATRWNSKYIMIDRLLEQKEAVTLYLASADTNVNNLTSREWTTIKELSHVLRPFYEVTSTMCAEKYPTLSMVIPVINGLMYSMEESEGGLDNLRKILKDNITERFGNIDDEFDLAVATLVDPRYKQVPFKSEESAANAKTKLLQAIRFEKKNNVPFVSNEQLPVTLSLNATLDSTIQAAPEVAPVANTASARNISKEVSVWAYFNKRVASRVKPTVNEESIRRATEQLLIQKIPIHLTGGEKMHLNIKIFH
jgi:hypothetical protein